MNLAVVRQRVKPWLLPIAMVGGVFFHDFIEKIAFVSPYLIFVMLFVTFCRVSPREFRVTGLSWSLLAIQVIGALLVYFVLLPVDSIVAQGAFICVFCPTATAAPVITGMLGGSVSRLAVYSIISNMTVAMLAPILLTYIGDGVAGTFLHSFASISLKVMPMIILPLVIALMFRRFMPRVHSTVANCQSVSFYVWSVALFIVVGRAVTFVIKEPASMIPEMVLIAVCSCVVCCLQFYVGRKIGRCFGDKIVGGQGLGQKNTILAIWISLTYLHPLASIAPASYVFWQNTINSWQLYHRTKMGRL